MCVSLQEIASNKLKCSAYIMMTFIFGDFGFVNFVEHFALL